MKRLRMVLWVIVALAAAGLVFLHFRPADDRQTKEPVTMVSFGGPFTLTGADGKPFSSARLNGKPYAIFFGFTNCPDVCPTTLARLVRLRQQIGKGDDAFEIVFVTVDPERDGPAEVGRYADMLGSPVIGLTGSPTQIEQVKKQFGIYSKKVPDEHGGYSVDHTATVLLFDRNGQFSSTIALEEQDAPALAKLKRLTT
ncbi:SCO family protein [Sphingomonas daechungensis]|uniref:SCO family protein n=1 Tax=Sphingomonas daechungensis TaxID=1176646 RepID=UPI0037841327